MSSLCAPSPMQTSIVFERDGYTWCNGSEVGDIGALKREWPAVELDWGEGAFCDAWLGEMVPICTGTSPRTRRVLVRFVMNEVIKQAAENFGECFDDWFTDADEETTHELVRWLERWLTKPEQA